MRTVINMNKLDRIVGTRYLEKLKLLGLDEKDDPYDPRNSHNFVDDMTKWPAVEYGHIFYYYNRTTRSLYEAAIATLEKLRCFQFFSEWLCERY